MSDEQRWALWKAHGRKRPTTDEPVRVDQVLSRECELVGGLRAFATAHGFGLRYVYDVLDGACDPNDAKLTALGLERVVTYRRRA